MMQEQSVPGTEESWQVCEVPELGGGVHEGCQVCGRDRRCAIEQVYEVHGRESWQVLRRVMSAAISTGTYFGWF